MYNIRFLLCRNAYYRMLTTKTLVPIHHHTVLHAHQRYGPLISFLCVVLVCLWYQNNVGLVKWVRKYSLLQFFGRFWGEVLNPLWMLNRIHLGNCHALDFCWGKVFYYCFNLFTRVWSMTLSTSSWFSLGTLILRFVHFF